MCWIISNQSDATDALLQPTIFSEQCLALDFTGANQDVVESVIQTLSLNNKHLRLLVLENAHITNEIAKSVSNIKMLLEIIIGGGSKIDPDALKTLNPLPLRIINLSE